MNYDLAKFLSDQKPIIEAGLTSRVPKSSVSGGERLNEALDYALFPGGQRWRPVFTLLGGSLIGQSDSRRGDDDALSVACAVEFLHTSSIILDDLPAMDDADRRRGKEAVHRVYGEAAAILAALALLNQSYALFTGVTSSVAAQKLVREASLCIGSNGMIGGQAADLYNGADRLCATSVGERNLKTTALTRLMMTAGAIAADAPDNEISALSRFGECLGLAYQIYDDLLDCSDDPTVLKPAHQDARLSRPSAVSDLGVDGAVALALGTIEEGVTVLRETFEECPALETIISASQYLFRELGKSRFATLPQAPTPEPAYQLA